MPQIEEEGFKDLIYKLAIYVPGVIIGLSAKLSKIRRHKKLTWQEALFQTTVAFSSAWIVWFILDYYGYSKLAAPASVVCGRFGDEVIIWVGSYVRKWARMTLESFK
ncbi:MAG: hypothetical protein QN716_01560 [Nitrososphaeraceae archaeon]|nr:hypothetical protein [Nitrososphaeraceae archaeon]